MSDYLIIDAVDGEEHDRYEDDLRGAIADAMVRAMGVPRSPADDRLGTLVGMAALVFAMIVCLLLGLAVVLAVAVPARREGKDLLTPQGERVVARVRERTESVATATKERTEGVLSTAKEKVGDVLPTR